jgi:hypothetical protein
MDFGGAAMLDGAGASAARSVAAAARKRIRPRTGA